MAKYYLGKKVNNEYVPVSTTIGDGSIISLVNFTNSFVSKKDLVNYLIADGLIDGTEELSYIIKKSEGFNPIYNGTHLCVGESKNYQDGNGLLSTLIREKYNLALYAYLCNSITDKYHANTNVSELRAIQEVTREVNYANSIGIDNYENTNDKRDLNQLIYRFLRSSIVKKDKDGNFVIKDRQYETDKRSLVDLMLMLNVFFEPKNIPEELLHEEVDYDRNEKEEFLTDEDFIAYGMNPDDYRHLIRN